MTDELHEVAIANAEKKYGLEGSMCMNIQESAYVKGFEDGAKYVYDMQKWHNLKKNPRDLPEKGVEVLNEDYDKVRYEATGFSGWMAYSEYEERDVEIDAPIAWCEEPQYIEVDPVMETFLRGR